SLGFVARDDGIDCRYWGSILPDPDLIWVGLLRCNGGCRDEPCLGRKNARRKRCLCNYALERGPGGARLIARGGRGARKALPKLLATTLWIRQAAGLQPGGSPGSHSGILRASFGAPGLRVGPARERTFALL